MDEEEEESGTTVVLPPPVVLTGRDATVAVINKWTRKFWKLGQELEERFEEFLVAQESFEESVMEVSDQVTEAGLAYESIIRGEEKPFSDAGGSGRDSNLKASLALKALTESRQAANQLMKREPEPAIVTGFIDSGSTNCFSGAYELKIRLEHVSERIRLLIATAEGLINEET